MSDASRPPAPECAREGCPEPAKWSAHSRRYRKYCSDLHSRSSGRGTCNKGKHPHPGLGERCKACKAEWEATRRGRPAPSFADTPRLPETRPVQSGGGWRPAGIDRYPAKGGPNDPRWTVA